MRLKARTVKVLLYRIPVVTLALIVIGCGTKSAPLPIYMKPELLYLKDQPYSRLYVEIDKIEGVEVPSQWLDELKTFLDKYCEKPDGIEIAQDPPISLSAVKGMPTGAASILCIDGPDISNNSQPAYLHVFFYDRNIGFKAEKGRPHVMGYCPCGILFDAGYFRISKGKAEEFSLKHELGHVLGLCKNPNHGDGAHCKNQGCLMYKDPGLLPSFGLLLDSRVEKQLCADCQRDIETWKSGDTDPKLSFKGPFLIRRETGYCVASLPYCDLIIPSTMVDNFDWQDALAKFKEITKEQDYGEYRKEDFYHIRSIFRPDDTEEVLRGMIDYQDILTKAAKDPNPFVRNYSSG